MIRSICIYEGDVIVCIDRDVDHSVIEDVETSAGDMHSILYKTTTPCYRLRG